jgi:hypothetical protein
MTRFIDLLNLEAGTHDRVFDDSSMFDINADDFSFIKEGESYDCKIELFGNFEREQTKKGVAVTSIGLDAVIGGTGHIQALIGSDVY